MPVSFNRGTRKLYKVEWKLANFGPPCPFDAAVCDGKRTLIKSNATRIDLVYRDLQSNTFLLTVIHSLSINLASIIYNV